MTMCSSIRRQFSSIPRYVLFVASLMIILMIFLYLTEDQRNNSNDYPQENSRTKRHWIWNYVHNIALPKTARQTKPNIVFILADDYGWKDIGYHGSEIRTPHLDELAAQGVKLENYYVQSSCSPTRASLLTGRYESQTSINRVLAPYETACLPLHLDTMPKALQEHGYTTHLVGKWHLGMSRWECLPNQRGFNTFLGYHGGSENYFKHKKDIAMKSFGVKLSGHDFWENENVTYQYEGQYSTHIYAQRTEDIIKDHATNGKPMFLMLSLQAVHEPMEVPTQYRKPYETLITDEKRQMLAGVTSCMDEAVRNVTRSLERYGLRDNTIVIFTSDNGGAKAIHSDNRPLRGNKGQYFEGGIRVVGFVNSPLLSQRVRGTEYRGLIGAADWFSTIVEGVAGGSTNATMDGYNVWDGIRSGAPSPRDEYLHSVGGNCEWTLSSPEYVRWMYGTLRQGPWKLLLGKVWQDEYNVPTGYVKHGWEKDGVTLNNEKYLFNLETDPYEQNNVFDQRPDITKQMIDRLREHCRKSVPPATLREMKEANPKYFGGVYTPWL